MQIKPIALRKTSEAVSAAFYPALCQTLLLIYEVNPYRIHATWHISRTDYITACNKYHIPEMDTAKLVLRFYDLSIPDSTEGLPLSFELPVEGTTNNWYIDLPAPANTLIADVGLQTDQGTFVWLATSNMVQIPPARPSIEEDNKAILAWHESKEATPEEEPEQQEIPAPITSTEFDLPQKSVSAAKTHPEPGTTVSSYNLLLRDN